MIRQFSGLVVALAVLGSGCGGDSTPPMGPAMPKAATISLATPNGDDGAIVLTLRGPDLSHITAASASYVVYTRFTGPEEARIIVMGDLVAGPVLNLTFAGGQSLSAYSASIEQVATRTDDLREAIAAYELKVTGF